MTNILIVDVNATTAYRLRKLIESPEVELHSATTVNESINRINNPNLNIDMVVVDVNLGPEDGFELINKLKEVNEQLLIVIMTSLNTRKSFVQGIKVGAVDYILKPYDEIYLQKKLRNHIKAIEKSKKLPEYSPRQTDNIIYESIKKAIREEYELLVGLLVIYHKKPQSNEGVNIRDLAILKTLLNQIKESAGPEDLFMTQGSNAIVMVLPKKNQHLKSSIQNYYKLLSEAYLLERELVDVSIAVEFISLPNEVDPSKNALAVLAQKIEKTLL